MKIKVTPTDLEWLREARSLLLSDRGTRELREATAQQLARLIDRAERAQQRNAPAAP